MTYWGRSTTNGSSFGVNWRRAMGGQFVASDKTLNGAEVYCSSAGNDLIRVAIYVGGTLSDPAGATLLEDLGTVAAPTTAGWAAISSVSNPTIPANSVVWIYLQSANNNVTVYADTDPQTSGDFQSDRGRADFGSADSAATLAAPATLPSGAFSNFWYSLRLDYADSTTTATRKGSEFTADKTIGTVTTATLAGVNVFDHLTAQDATTATFAGGFTDEITTSGTYDLVLGDGATTETISVQVNVVGLPSNTLKKAGSLQINLTDIKLNAFNASDTLVEQLTGLASNGSGVMSPVDLSSLSEAVGDNLTISLYSASATTGITFVQALELI